MRDRGISHQAFDVALANGGDGAKEHRGHRQKGDDLAPIGGYVAERVMHDAREQPHRGHLGRGGEEGRDGRGRAFVDVGRPHVEGRGGHLERQPGDDEDQTEQQTQRRVFGICRLDDAAKHGGARKAIGQRGAI